MGVWKLTPINATQYFMDWYLVKYSMQQDRHNFITQNSASALMKYSRTKCRPLGLLSQQGIDYKRYEKNKKCPLASIYDR